MPLAEFTAVEHLAQALGPPSDIILADMDERTVAMHRAVDEVVARYAPRIEMSAPDQARNLKIVDGLASMMSEKIEQLAAELARLDDPFWKNIASEIHDDTVRQYWRLTALRAELDPECRAAGESLGDADAVGAWADRLFAASRAEA